MQVVWQRHTLQVGRDENGDLNIYDIPSTEPVNIKNEGIENYKEDSSSSSGFKETIIKKKTKAKSKVIDKTKKRAATIKERKKEKKTIDVINYEPTKLEENPTQVKERFKRGCECQDESCFRGLCAKNVYKHRLNIAELTKAEHDMYLMGVTMACLANPDTTVRQKERQRLRAQYVYQGRRVCLDAFLYLENCTHYQLKRIRKHVMTHGVAPRVHGNHGKKPHNTFPLDIYQHATEFLKQFLKSHNITNPKTPIQLPWSVTRKKLHNSYKEYGQLVSPGVKLMGYSTFRHFLKEQFPNVRFCKIEPKSLQHQTHEHVDVANVKEKATTTASDDILDQVQQQQVIQVVAQQSTQPTQPATFLIGSVSQLMPNGDNSIVNIQTNQSQNNHNFPYQISNDYIINDQGNLITTMPNQSYIFNRI